MKIRYKRIWVDEEIVRGTTMNRRSTVTRLVKRSLEADGSSEVPVTVDFGGGSVPSTGWYRAVGNLRPVLYHVYGENPLQAPKQPKHKEANLRPCDEVVYKTGHRTYFGSHTFR